MDQLSILQWVNIVIVMFALIPTVVLLHQYIYAKITDYLLFAAFFISSSITLIATILVQRTEKLIFFQIHNIFYVTSFILLFLHALRIKWEKSPKQLKYFGIIWYLVLVVTTLFWKKFPQPRPETSKVLVFDIPTNYSSFAPLDAGLEINNTIIYSSGNALMGILFYQFVLIFMIYSYVTMDPVLKTERIIRSKKLFIISWILFLLWTILILPWLADIFKLPNAILIVTIAIVSYIAVVIPEAVLISHSQLQRARGLYKFVEDHSTRPQKIFTINPLLLYLKSIPSKYLDDHQSIT